MRFLIILIGVLLVALSFAQGSLEWTTGAAGTTFTVSGLTFQPKAIRAWMMGFNTATDGASTANWLVSVGFATSTSDRRCVVSFSEHGAGSANCATGYTTVNLVAGMTTTPGFLGALDLDSITSDGFVLIVDEALGAVGAQRVFWEAWGGSDITNVATGEISEPAATGTQDYTTAGFQPDIVLFAGSKQTSENASSAIDNGMCVGAADASGNQWVFAANSDDGSANMDTDRYGQDGECLATIVEAGGNPTARATLTTMLSTGFQLDWLARATTNRKSIYLAIKGGQWRVGTYTLNTGTGGNTATVSGLPFQPVGCLQATQWTSEQIVGNSGPEAYIGMGRFSSTSDRSGATAWDQNTLGTSAIVQAIEYDQVLTVPNTTPTIEGSIDVNAVNSDGFEMIVDDAVSGGTSMFFGYVTFASSAVAGTPGEESWWGYKPLPLRWPVNVGY